MNRSATVYLLRLLIIALPPVFLPFQAQAQGGLFSATAGPYADLALPPGAQPVRVSMAFHLDRLHHIDDEAETFDLAGVLTLRWLDPRQAFDPIVIGTTEKVFSGNYQFNEISPGWFPLVALINATDSPGSQGVVYRVAPDGSSTVVQQFHATVRSALQLRRFPFDAQKLQMTFAVLGFNSDEVILVPAAEGASMTEGIFHLPEWELSAVGMAPKTDAVWADSANSKSSAVVVQLEVERQSFFMVRLVLGPLALIVLLSWSVFWMERSSLGDRMAVSFVGILTAVAYQSMVSDIMPNIAYVTFLNAFMVMSMFLMSATVAVNLTVAAFDKRGDVDLGNRVDLTCRWAFPLAYAFLIGLSILVTFTLLG